MARGDLPKIDPKSLPGPGSIHRQGLANGITFVARENFASPSVVLSGFLTVGSLDEDREHAGLAALTASCLMRGTANRSFTEIYESIESIGASLHLSAGKHHTSFSGKALAEDLDTLLTLLAEVLTQPSFPKLQFDRLRAEKLTALAIRDQDTSSRAIMRFNELVYRKHPYSVSTDGYKETVAQLTPTRLRSFHRKHYSPLGMVICVVGGVEAEAAAAMVSKRLGDWKIKRGASQPDLPPLAKATRASREYVPLAGKTQCDLVMGVAGPPRRDPRYLGALLGNNILGRFGMYGRIGDAVRERAGLAYYAYSTVSGGLGPGPWQVLAGVNPANLDLAIGLIQNEVRAFAQKPPSREELQDNQANFIGRLPLQLESNEGVAGALVNIERYDLGLDYYQRYPSLVADVTAEEIQEIVTQYLRTERLQISSAGPDQHGA